MQYMKNKRILDKRNKLEACSSISVSVPGALNCRTDVALVLS